MSSSGITYKDIDLLTRKAAVSGDEKLVVSADEYITPEQIAGMVDLSGKVDKIPGMGLSQNDFKDADKLKLDRLENYDDTALKRRMTEAEGDIADIELVLPTFITKTVNDLTNYYLKSETYTREEVAALIAQIQGMEFVPVQTLPTASADTLRKIYLVPAANPQTANQIDEYYTQDNGSGASPRYTWELFGSAALDLSGYVTTTALNAALASYTTTADLITLLSGKQDTIADLVTIRSGAAAGATAVQPGDLPTVPTISTDISADKASDTKTASPKAVADYVEDSVVAVSAPTPNDGTIIFTHRNGDTDTVDLNHVHPQYALKVEVESSQPVGGMAPNTLYNLGTLSGAVTFSFAAPTDNTIRNEYMFTFDSGTPAAVPTWPNSITAWVGNCLDANGDPEIAASKHYEVSVVGAYGLIAEF